jgi:hypothetical protein
MPDVKMWRDPSIQIEDKEAFLDKLREEVAVDMSCYVFQNGNPEPVLYVLDNDEVDITVFDVISGKSKSLVIIEVSAYAFEGRMINIEDRLKDIAAFVRDYFGLPDDSVSISFAETAERCWTKA